MRLTGVHDAALLTAAVAVVSFVVLGHAYSSFDGYISPDSANYLRLAERLLDGHGFHVPSDGRDGPSEVWFAIWPPGYSLVIAAVSWVTGASTFLAAKMANVAIFSGSLFLLYRFLGRDSLIAGTLLFSAGTLHIFSMTWSEVPFLASLIFLCLLMGGILTGDRELRGVFLWTLPVIIVLPFAFRYIGIFVLVPVGLVALRLYRDGRSKDALRLVLAAGVAVLICAAYLGHNWLQTGHLTGIERIPAPESHSALFNSFAVALMRELALPVVSWTPANGVQSVVVAIWALGGLFVGTQLLRAGPAPLELRVKLLSLVFLIVGATYLVSIAILRWYTHFDPFSARLLDPGFSLLTIGATIWMLNAFRAARGPIIAFLLATALLSVSNHAASILSRDGFGTYATAREAAIARYAMLPDDAIVVFGENELRYLRPDVQIAYPRFRPYSADDEDWQSFLETLQPNVPVFIEVGPRASMPNRYHPSVREAVATMPRNTVTLLQR